MADGDRSRRLWLVLDGQWPVFACWIYCDSIPATATSDGRLTFPSEVVCLEDSIASPSYRGRGLIAPAAWSQVAYKLGKTGIKSIITRVEKDLKTMRWVLPKAGFREIATTRLRRIGPRKQLTIAQSGTTATARWLTENLQR